MLTIVRVLAVTGAIGFATGVFLVPTWQDVIEPAQVLAGLVAYPPENPVALYSTHTWTLLHQLSAVLLRAGLSERVLALLFSGLTGLISFQALGMTILAVGGDETLAWVMPFFIHSVQATVGGVGYPVLLLGSIYTSGTVGLSFLLLVFALVGTGAYAAAALLLGLAPAVHVVLGAWGFLVVAITVLRSERDLREDLWDVRWWFVVGALTAVSSAVVHRIGFTLGPGIGRESAVYMSAVMTYWDNHRRPFTRLSIGAAPAVLGTLFSAVWLWRFRDHLPRPSWFLLRALLVAASLGATLSGVLAVDPSIAGFWLWRMMPSRLMNLPTLACLAVIVGLTARSQDPRSQLVLAGMVVVLNLILVIEPRVMAFASYYVMLVGGVALVYLASRFERNRLSPTKATQLARWTSLAIPVAMLVFGGWRASASFAHQLDALADRTNDNLFATIASRPGLLLTASDLHLIQLRTRRAVLLDGGALDGLAYVPAAAPATERILRDAYGVDLLAPGMSPREANGALAHNMGKDLWQARTIGEWQKVRGEFGVTDVLTFADWTLRLPEIARNGELVLYAIP